MTDRLTYLDARQRLCDAAMAWSLDPHVIEARTSFDALLKRLDEACKDYADASLRTGLGDPVRLAPGAAEMFRDNRP